MVSDKKCNTIYLNYGVLQANITLHTTQRKAEKSANGLI